MQSQPFKAAMFGNTGPAGETIEKIYSQRRLEILRHRTALYPQIITSKTSVTICQSYTTSKLFSARGACFV